MEQTNPQINEAPLGERALNAQAAWLQGFAVAHGTAIAGGGNRPIELNDPEVLWFVSRGSVNLFIAREQKGELVEFKQLLRAEQGRLLFPTDSGANQLIVKGLPESELIRIPRRRLLEADEQAVVVRQVDLWVAEVSMAIAEDVTYRPYVERFVTLGSSVELQPDTVVSTKGGVVWVSSEDGKLAFLSTEEADPAGCGYIPLALGSWASASEATVVQVASSQELNQAGLLMVALAEFQRLALSADDLNRRLLLADAANLRNAQAQYREESVQLAQESLIELLDTGGANRDGTGDALEAALQLIGDYEGIRFHVPPPPRDPGPDVLNPSQSLERILIASGVRGRDVALGADDRWWFGDSGAMLAFRREDGAPVALLPSWFGRYRIVHPMSGRSEPVNAERVGSLYENAIFFYQSLSQGKRSGVGRLAEVAFRRTHGDALRFVAAGLLTGLAMLVPAVLLGLFADEVVPSGRVEMLAWLTGGTFLLALTAGLLKMLEGTAVMRLEGRAAARLTAALWDRLLDLPALFFRRFTSGDLATRALTFQGLRDQISGIVTGALLSTIFLLPTFVLLFLYDAVLGWIGLVVGLALLAITVTLGGLQVSHHRRLAAAQRTLSGVMLQLIGAAHKLRATGKEWTAFTRWAKGYRAQTRSTMDVGALNEHLVAFTSMTPMLATAVLFTAVAIVGPDTISAGMFLAVYAAYMVFMAAIAALGQSMSGVAAIMPAVEQVDPILKAQPKRGEDELVAMPKLRGGVRLEQVTFRYHETGPVVLHNVSIDVEPGEFIALVGGSGSGKSTVLRLILGLEKPISGAVYYDGRDLDRVNRRALRKQIGMVAQDGTLGPRTLSDNIIGLATDLTVDDAWRAARLVAVDGDIAAMPMGMFTVVTENSAAFSGGQVQRIMLASALVNNPRLLLLDEATSWLDNTTQAKVMERIEELAITRIVVAHRLSTIRNADRIYVLDQGEIAQQGTYSQLIETPGIFRDLASRQAA